MDSILATSISTSAPFLSAILAILSSSIRNSACARVLPSSWSFINFLSTSASKAASSKAQTSLCFCCNTAKALGSFSSNKSFIKSSSALALSNAAFWEAKSYSLFISSSINLVSTTFFSFILNKAIICSPSACSTILLKVLLASSISAWLLAEAIKLSLLRLCASIKFFFFRSNSSSAYCCSNLSLSLMFFSWDKTIFLSSPNMNLSKSKILSLKSLRPFPLPPPFLGTLNISSNKSSLLAKSTNLWISFSISFWASWFSLEAPLALWALANAAAPIFSL